MEPAGPERRPIMRQLFRKKCKEFDNKCWIFHGTLLNHTGPTCLLNRWPTPQSLRCWHTLGFFYIWQRKTHAALTFITSDHATELYVLVTTGAFYQELKNRSIWRENRAPRNHENGVTRPVVNGVAGKLYVLKAPNGQRVVTINNSSSVAAAT